MASLLTPIDLNDQPVLQRAREIYARECGGVLHVELVPLLTAEHGVDVATAVLYVHFETLWLACRAPLRFGTGNDVKPLLLAIAPGAFYKQHPEVGADGHELLELAATQPWDCELIPCESLGTVQANANIIVEFLNRRQQTHHVVLASLSKGTMDARAARHQQPDVFDALAAWVSVSGVWHGTMMSDWLLDKWYLRPVMKLMLWRHGVTSQPIEDLRYRPQSPTEATSHSATCPLYHVAAFPLWRHLSCRRSRLWHRRFRRHGPNDSVVLLQDLLILPGTVVPVWGSDHYLQGPSKAAALVSELISRLPTAEHRDAQGACQPVSSAART